MFFNNRKTIGVMTEAVINEFPSRMCQGIICEAKKRGYNVALFSCYGKYGNHTEYLTGDSQLFELPPFEMFDGLVLLLDSIQDIPTRERVLSYAQERCRCPVVSVREQIEGFNNLLIDNRTCMEPVIRHFLDVHKFTRLCFMTGPKDRWYAVERLDCFLSIMKERGLAVDEHQIFYGDFWKNMGGAACDWFFSGPEMPQAIICANDHMASAVASELIKRGYKIPKDICVSGYDGLTDTIYFSPSLTTESVPFYDMGMKAVQIIDEKQETPSQFDDYYFDVQIHARESCGCQKIHDQEVITSRRYWYERIQDGQRRKVQFNFLSIYLSECTSINEIGTKLLNYVSNIDGYKDYCVCLCKNLETSEPYTDYSEEMELRIAIQNGQPFHPVRIPFDRNELLPAEVTSDEPQAWYFIPLHFLNRTFGYEAIQFIEPEPTANIFFDWSTNICNAIQDVLIHQRMQTLITELRYMYNRDTLTGMYNRRGFEKWAGNLLAEAKMKQQPFFLAILDLDGMKQINDNFGHVEGDFALKKVRDAIWNSNNDTKTSARTGGDEFILFTNNITEEQGKKQIDDIESFLERFNQSGEKPYQIHASVGYFYQIPNPEDSLETYVKYSDAIMYKNKSANKKRRNEPLR